MTPTIVRQNLALAIGLILFACGLLFYWLDPQAQIYIIASIVGYILTIVGPKLDQWLHPNGLASQQLRNIRVVVIVLGIGLFLLVLIGTYAARHVQY